MDTFATAMSPALEHGALRCERAHVLLERCP